MNVSYIQSYKVLTYRLRILSDISNPIFSPMYLCTIVCKWGKITHW